MKRSAGDAAKTRVALLEAALMSFEEKGWPGATFERVAERAGVTRGAVHHHFRSKSELLTEALEWGWAEYGNQLFTQEVALPTAAGQLNALLGDFVALLRSDELFRALASTTVLVAPQALDDSSRKHEALDGWRDQIAASLSDDTDVPVPPKTVAGLVLVLIQGFTVTAVTRPDDLPQPEHLDAAIAALVRGLLS
ncbi:TetR/AcrR family transcriptional regulator [Brevibacterium sp. FME17]|uniref:TetR/AcrR family transcriptional regulator n=1 Tax=Brevibacterium sp. FME17 TaxID=2742606 RepID=UPI0018691AC4|nr:TetR/AcrR family transcriptional regulator [Brevibacterium sp. FME17]